MNNFQELDGTEIAVIGMTCRFPQAKNVDEFWHNLRDGVESIVFFSDQELEASGVDAATLANPNYVKAGAVLEDIEMFDAPFFAFNPRAAEILDPQHRLFLECAWEALEGAGYDPETYKAPIGVFAGVFMSTYLFNIYSNPHLVTTVGELAIRHGNEKDYLTTRISYKLNLRGPSISVQTSCSTALVAVHVACQSLMNGECDMALAGGVSIRIPQKMGYMYEEGGILSPDGHCRAFDARAKGTIFGQGLGIVVLKRLADALTDGDCIRAIIKGTAINNDGAAKVGYTAPSVNGQAEVIGEALALANVNPETITYLETHGTGTSLGDPIEIAALTQAFVASTERKGFCAIGSVKTNVGHLGAAAGIAGLIKAILALKYKAIPPSLHFAEPNPHIDFANSPFYVNTTLTEWKTTGTPRRAGVSSFGMGGTNAHAVLEEAPAMEASSPSRPWQVLVLSAKTSTALEAATANLVEHLKLHPDRNLADVAYTLQVGRRAFNHRRMVVCHDLDDGLTALRTLDRKRVLTAFQEPRARPIAFMFPGQGAQYVNMASELYQVEPTFREQVDTCTELLKPHLGIDLRTVLYPGEAEVETASERLKQTFITQPALFVIEYALARLWMEWGVRPQAMIGHSIGEYVAACLSDVLSLEDALSLVAVRGHLMQEMPAGSMLAVPLPEREVQQLLNTPLSLAVVNGPSLCVVAGPTEAVEAFNHRLAKRGVECRWLHTSHAFHSTMMDPIVGAFMRQVQRTTLKPPQIPYLSNVTGTWITTAEATDPGYWAAHLRQTVRFAEGVRELLKEPDRILLEVGPGQTLSTLAKQSPGGAAERVVLASLHKPRDQQGDVPFLLNTLGQLWLAGVPIAWPGFYAHERRLRVPLPTYPFERQRYWIEAQGQLYDTHQEPSSKEPDTELEKVHLSEPTHPRPTSDSTYVSPRDETERIIADMWQELFGIREVSIYDNFFDLEGNSLLAIQLISRLRNTFQVEFPLEKLFEEPTVAGLAKLIAEGQPGQEELEQLLQEIETLSADEVREELVKESPPTDEEERSLG